MKLAHFEGTQIFAQGWNLKPLATPLLSPEQLQNAALLVLSSVAGEFGICEYQTRSKGERFEVDLLAPRPMCPDALEAMAAQMHAAVQAWYDALPDSRLQPPLLIALKVYAP